MCGCLYVWILGCVDVSMFGCYMLDCLIICVFVCLTYICQSMFGHAVQIHIYQLLCIYPAGTVYMHIYTAISVSHFLIYYIGNMLITQLFGIYEYCSYRHITQLFWTSEKLSNTYILVILDVTSSRHRQDLATLCSNFTPLGVCIFTWSPFFYPHLPAECGSSDGLYSSSFLFSSTPLTEGHWFALIENLFAMHSEYILLINPS